MRLLVVFAILLATPGQCLAEVNCGDALIKDTYNVTISDQLNWQMASLVTESQYNEAKQGGGLNIVIYGIPMGANYSDFKKNINNASHARSESLNHNSFQNILWTYLDPSAAGAYSACVKAELDTPGIHIAVKSASETDISISISYAPRNNDPVTITPMWQWRGKIDPPFPKTLTAGSIDFVVLRPVAQQTLALRWKGSGDSVILDPVPPPAPPQPAPTLVNSTLSKLSDNLPSGSCAHWSDWYALCTDNEPPDWKVVSHSFQLTGDRSCSGWAHCEITESSPTRVCYRFQMQGHNEQCGHSGNTGIQSSRGVLQTTWAHQ